MHAHARSQAHAQDPQEDVCVCVRARVRAYTYERVSWVLRVEVTCFESDGNMLDAACLAGPAHARARARARRYTRVQTD